LYEPLEVKRKNAATGTLFFLCGAILCHSGKKMVQSPGQNTPLSFFSSTCSSVRQGRATDLNAHARDILAWFVSRWQVEVAFQETRRHLGVETQRQWSDKAILRTTPVLLGLFSIVTLWAHDLCKSRKLKPRTTAWYPKAVPTFSDPIAAVRREIRRHQISFMSRPHRDSMEIASQIWNRMEDALAQAA
jgi:hypothetical protein